jgi:hypothetical protein
MAKKRFQQSITCCCYGPYRECFRMEYRAEYWGLIVRKKQGKRETFFTLKFLPHSTSVNDQGD